MPFCRKCGTEFPEDTLYCPKCGFPTELAEKSGKRESNARWGQTIQREGIVYGVVNLENLPVGHVIDDRYEIKAKIGQGGFGAVYRAFDRLLQIDKAIKVIPEIVTNDVVAMDILRQEARTMIRLKHQNIVHVYDLHESDQISYIDMEFIDGVSLAEYRITRPNKRLTEEEVIHLALQILQGLSYAHSQNVIHRDIKPQNIMLSKNGIIKIMDFGIAETLRSSMSVIQTSSTTGTIVYMSPEQVRGKNISRRSDIYSFGATLYELLNGNPPFFTGDITFQILNEEPQPLSHISDDMNAILMKCLQKNPEDRFQTADELITTIKNIKKIPICPICHEKKKVERFKCPECGRENICIDHKTSKGICIECFEKKEQLRLAEIEKRRLKEIENLKQLEKSGKIDAFIRQKKGNLSANDYDYFINRYCKKPIDKRTVIKLLKNSALNYTLNNDKSFLKSNFFRLIVGAIIIVLIVIIYDYTLGNKSILSNFITIGKNQNSSFLKKDDVKWVLVQGGQFKMGCSWSQSDCDRDERPQHNVIVRSFKMSKYEITFSQFDKFCEETKRPKPYDKGWGRGDNPVINVTWFDAVEFCNWLSNKMGLQACYSIKKKPVHSKQKLSSNWLVKWNLDANGIRLPTEAEFELAARGGAKGVLTKFSGSNNPNLVAWYAENSKFQSHPVGLKMPNKLGLYDMSGNVWEWCWDWYNKNYYSNSPRYNPTGPTKGKARVIRGGSFMNKAKNIRLTNRNYEYPDMKNSGIGFRVVRNYYEK